jgi:type III pantothenate kinase
MILIDVGNTSIHFGLAKDNQGNGFIKDLCRLDSKKPDSKRISAILHKYPSDKVLVCSVVPKVTDIFEKLKSKFKNRIFIIGKDIEVPIKSFYNPKKIGIDRLVGAYAAKKLYPRARIIIDFGTAITFDFLSIKGDYQGGFILPGIGSSLKVLEQCALLPKAIVLKRATRFIPRDTAESISKGMEEGFSAMINRLESRYRAILGLTTTDTVVITGGDGGFIMDTLEFPYIFDKDLVFKGLKLLASPHRTSLI